MKKIIFLAVSILLMQNLFATTYTFAPTELDSLIAKAPKMAPGDSMQITPGTFNFKRVIIDCRGLINDSIVVYAQTPGSVILAAGSTLDLRGSYWKLTGMLIQGDIDTFAYGNSACLINAGAVGIRVTNCTWNSYNYSTAAAIARPKGPGSMSYIAIQGINNKVDHCTFHGQTAGRTMIFPMSANFYGNTSELNLYDARPSNGGNGGENIRIGASQAAGLYFMKDTVRNCLFRDFQSEQECISMKANGLYVANNTFLRITNTPISFRGGQYNIAEGNFILGSGTVGNGAAFKVYDAHNIIRNNYIQDATGYGFTAPIQLMTGAQPAAGKCSTTLPQVIDLLIENNTFVNSKSYLAIGYDYNGNGGRNQSPQGVTFRGNIFQSNGAERYFDTTFRAGIGFIGVNNFISTTLTPSGYIDTLFTKLNPNLTVQNGLYRIDNTLSPVAVKALATSANLLYSPVNTKKPFTDADAGVYVGSTIIP